MKCQAGWLLAVALAPASGLAADRGIVVAPKVQSSWEFPTHTNAPRLRPKLGVGFWQRASGAAPGVGSHYISALEYQLPEAAPARVRSASFQFSGRPSQCEGTEPVVIEVSAYAGDGKGEVGDTRAGSRVAQLSADCSDRNAFARPIDVTAIVRQQSVASGVRYVGFNVRKANNRQGPGLFELAPGKLTVVLADEAAVTPAAAAAGTGAASTKALSPTAGTRTAAVPEPELSKKEIQRKERRAYVQSDR